MKALCKNENCFKYIVSFAYGICKDCLNKEYEKILEKLKQ